MPLAGGPADKAGNRYECKWVVRQFIRILMDEVEWIHLEPPGPVGDGIEFKLRLRDGTIQVHQAKRQKGLKGVWTISDLAQAGVLDAVCRHSLDEGEDFHFVSTEAVKSLKELAERARDADGLGDFEKNHLPASAVGELDAFCRTLGGVDHEAGFRALRRFYPTAQSELSLGVDISAFLAMLVDGDGEMIADILAAWALEKTHRRIIASDIWDELARHGFRPSSLANDRSLAVGINHCTDDYLQSQPTDIGGLNIRRSVSDDGVALFKNDGKRTVFLLGGAGIGKTVVSSQIVTAIRELSWPVLALRMDRLELTVRKDEIGRQLFGRAASPVAILAAVAQGRDCLLTVEQLDAVSTVSGRSPDAFRCVADMIREARVHANMRVLLVCREFDLQNDQRFRDLRSDERRRSGELKVEPFSPDEVREALVHLQIDIKRLDARQLELLRLPLHLSLLAGIRAEMPEGNIPFANPKDLFDAYWRSKQASVLPLLSNRNNFQIILEALCREMTQSQKLSVPRGVLLPWADDARKLVSGGLLIDRTGRVAFFHEGFFDYVFARNFCDSGQPLVEFLSRGDQDLFIRGPVRQILTYRRDQDFAAYLTDADTCIRSPNIRFHLKKIIVAVIGQARQPESEEWELLRFCLGETAPGYAGAAQSALWPSAAWFRFLHDNGALTSWLGGTDDSMVNFAFNYIGNLAEQEPRRAAELLRMMTEISPEGDLRVLNVLRWSDGTARHAELEKLLFDILSRPDRDWVFRCKAFTDIHPHGPGRAGLAARVLGLFLQLLSETSEVRVSDQDIYRVFPEHEIKEIADKAPDELAQVIVSPLLKLMERFAEKEGDGPPWPDSIWRGSLGDLEGFGPYPLLHYAANSLKHLAVSAPDEYEHLVGLLMAVPFRTAQAVVLRALAVPAETAKNMAVRWLTGTWLRQEICFHDEEVWDTRVVLETLAPLLTAQDVERLEPLILGHWETWDGTRPSWEPEEEYRRYLRHRIQYHRESLGWCQHQLLGVLSLDHLSPTGRRRRQELGRKFVDRKLERPTSIRGGWVRPPIKDSAIERMTDDQWLSAIQQYDKAGEREWLAHEIIGGAEQLAHAMSERLKREPERFARLALRIPAEANEHYFNAVASGLSNAELPLDLLAEVGRLLHQRPGRHHGRWLPSLIATNGDQALPDDLLAMIRWYAVLDPDPEADIWREERQTGAKMYGGDALFHGINTVRGASARAIACLVARDRRYWEYFRPEIEALVSDKTISVRTCAAEICSQGLRYDRERAVALFLRLLDADDAVLVSNPIEGFVHYSGAHDWPAMQPVVERMLASPADEAREAGARQGTLMALSHSEAAYLAERALAGDTTMRKGAAEVLSHNVVQHPGFCMAPLTTLFNDPDQKVREAADNWVSRVSDRGTLDQLLPMVHPYLASAAFADHPDSFFEMIKAVTDAPPSLLFDAANRFPDVAGREVADIRSQHTLAGRTVSELILRAYRQAETDQNLRLKCLDLFDRLVSYGTYGAEQALESWDVG